MGIVSESEDFSQIVKLIEKKLTFVSFKRDAIDKDVYKQPQLVSGCQFSANTEEISYTCESHEGRTNGREVLQQFFKFEFLMQFRSHRCVFDCQ